MRAMAQEEEDPHPALSRKRERVEWVEGIYVSAAV